MEWEEKQKKKIFQDYSSGNITQEQYNDMISALDKTNENRARGEVRNISKSVRYIAMALIILVAYFVIREMSNYLIMRELFSDSNKQVLSDVIKTHNDGIKGKTNSNSDEDMSLDEGSHISSMIMNTGNNEFIELCKTGSTQKISEALKNGADANAKEKGMTPLMAAAGYNPNPEVITFLAEKGADVNFSNVSGNTPLIAAVSNNSNPEVTKALIMAGAGIHASDVNGATPLILAASNNSNKEVLATLIEAGADVNAVNILEKTPLLMAAGNNSNPDAVSVLIKAGANVNALDADGKNPLIMAASNKNLNPRMITDLVSAGTDVNVRDKYGLTPLMLAVGNEKSNSEAITAIVKAGVNVNTPDEDGKTPLMEAARRNSNPEVIITLLSLGADQRLKDDADKMAIDYARENKDLKDAGALQKLQSKEFSAAAGATYPARPTMSDYRFLDLCRKGSPQQINDAMKKGANAKAKNNTGATSLMYAARENPHPESMTALVKAGSGVNAQDVKGLTPLMIAVRNNPNQQVTLSLLQLGADVNVKDNNGKTAVDYATGNKKGIILSYNKKSTLMSHNTSRVIRSPSDGEYIPPEPTEKDGSSRRITKPKQFNNDNVTVMYTGPIRPIRNVPPIKNNKTIQPKRNEHHERNTRPKEPPKLSSPPGKKNKR